MSTTKSPTFVWDTLDDTILLGDSQVDPDNPKRTCLIKPRCVSLLYKSGGTASFWADNLLYYLSKLNINLLRYLVLVIFVGCNDIDTPKPGRTGNPRVLSESKN